jgi:hypothetical protein
MNISSDSLATELRRLWHEELFSTRIYPDFPFRPRGWRAVAFNRDLHGNARIPIADWKRLLDVLRTHSTDEVALLLTPYADLNGLDPPQPIVLPLAGDAVVSQFLDREVYFPEFFLSGESRSWAVRGDSDFSIVGGEDELMSVFIDVMGGASSVLERMKEEFGVGDCDEDREMRIYLESLLAINRP